MITSIGADRADAATPPHLAVDDAAATATANNNNEREQSPDGEEHAAVSSSSSLLLSSSATISMPPVALPEVAAVALVEADDHRQQQQQTPYEKAIAHATTLQSTLSTLLSQKSQLESSAITEWSTKISNYESQSLREMNDELQFGPLQTNQKHHVSFGKQKNNSSTHASTHFFLVHTWLGHQNSAICRHDTHSISLFGC